MTPSIVLYTQHAPTCPAPDVNLELAVVTSPASCLCHTLEGALTAVAISFQQTSMRQRQALIELCATLRKNAHTARIPLLAVLSCANRNLLERLREVGVELATISQSEDSSLLQRLSSFTAGGSSQFKLETILCRICPYINYVPISGSKEIVFCAAYRNRLVLGSERLTDLCETRAHKTCDYFIRPKRQQRRRVRSRGPARG